MNALFIKDLAIKTHRGLEGRVRKGRSAGGRAYGYRVVKPKNEEDRGRLKIHQEEAITVRRIFEAFKIGKSPREIAQELNEEGITGPTGNILARHNVYAVMQPGVRGFLRNDLYSGRRVWNKQGYERDPVTQKRIARPNPPEEWIITDVPETADR